MILLIKPLEMQSLEHLLALKREVGRCLATKLQTENQPVAKHIDSFPNIEGSSESAVKIAILGGIFFDNSKVPMQTIASFVGYYVTLTGPKTKYLQFEFYMGSNTVIHWSNFIREVLMAWVEDNSMERIAT